MPYTILLVDDDRDFHEELAENFFDYRIIDAYSGEEALRIFQKPNEIDLIILDEKMPGLRGTDVLKKIRAKDPDIGIIILTGHSTKDVAINAVRGHADNYIEKPINITLLKEVIADLLEDTTEPKDMAVSGIRSKIERTKHFAERNYHKQVTLNDAASIVYLSPKYLSRAFKKITGKGFSDYCIDVKMKKAKELLKKTEYTIEHIATSLGYENMESFIRAFKKTTKLTPTEFRKKPIENSVKPKRKLR
ncbi:MAG: response regulator [Elusimicrobia bacterium]|nr:response regulator [Elusimicrobiota bacterium]MBD3411486.1 response regulator [Elusimicrobiota bacterium]